MGFRFAFNTSLTRPRSELFARIGSQHQAENQKSDLVVRYTCSQNDVVLSGVVLTDPLILQDW